jgi:hypothetical protein
VITDQVLIKRLNFLRNQPEWVYRETSTSTQVLKPAIVPDQHGFYWLAGTTITAAGVEIPSVFVVDTDAGAEQYRVYWYIDGHYYESQEFEEVARLLGVPSSNVFPFRWRYHVPVANDIHV